MPEPRIEIVVAWSGGKDSALALHRLRQDPAVHVAGLLTTVTLGHDRVSIHGVRRTLLHAQAAAAGLPLWEAAIPPVCTNADYETAMRDGLARIERDAPDVTAIAFGDLFLADVRAYREAQLAATRFDARFPLWGEPTDAIAREVIALGFAATLVCVDTSQLDGGFAGRRYDAALLDALPAGVDPCGERGEFHTFVSAGPIFADPIPVEPGERVLRDGRFQYVDLLPAAPPA